MSARSALVAGTVLTAVAAGGCQSTQDKAAALEQEGKGAFTERGVAVGKVNPDVEVVDTAVLSDPNGAAAVVVLRNRKRRAERAVPVAIDVRGAGGKSLFRNDAPGLEPSLTSLPVVPPGRTVTWVNDQVVAASEPRRVSARIGMAKGGVKGRVPRLRTTNVKLDRLATTGLAATGFVVNASKIEQRELVLHGVARRGRKIVAAGRAQVRRVKPGRRSRFRMFFIGDPKGADLRISVPPTRLR